MEKLIETIVGAIQDKKGKDIVSLDLSGFDGAICSHFVVCNADSTMQVAAIADGVEEAVEEKLGEKVWRVEGKQTGSLGGDGLHGRRGTYLHDRVAFLLQIGGAVGRCAAQTL